MHDELWASVELKVDHAAFFLELMGRSIQPPEWTATEVAIQSAGGTYIDPQWQRAFYAYLDAFLATARSIPEIINCCFGKDIRNGPMRTWFDKLDAAEQSRRGAFSKKFEKDREKFARLGLSNARNITFHRGVAPVEVRISGLFGVTYTGNPLDRVPAMETSPNAGGTVTAHPLPVQPKPSDFTTDGKLLFDECDAYLGEARNLVEKARSISLTEHGSQTLTPPLR